MDENKNNGIYSLRVSHKGMFTGKLRGIKLMVGDSKNGLYFNRYLSHKGR